jgi:hypothetical protein
VTLGFEEFFGGFCPDLQLVKVIEEDMAAVEDFLEKMALLIE